MAARDDDASGGGQAPRGDSRRDRDLLRYLHRELPAAEALRLEAELVRNADLAARLAELERVWRRLEPPPVAVPVGEGARLAREAWRRRRLGGRLSTWLAGGERAAQPPAWGRPLVGGALAAGLALGVWLGQPALPFREEPPARLASARTEASTAGGSATTTSVPAPPPVAVTGAGPPAPPAPAEPDPIAVANETVAPEDDPAAGESEWSDGSALAGELTLAEAYLQALESGDPSDWEGSGP